jgi:hypothetical protein
VTDKQTELFVAALDTMRAEPRPEFVVSLGHRLRAEATGEADPDVDVTEDYLRDEIIGTPETDHRADEPRPAYRWPLGIAAAVFLVGAMGAAVFLATRGDDTSAPATQAQTFSVDSGFEVADAYFAAYNSGDADAVLALFTDDATYSDNLTSDARPNGWELDVVWRLAQGETLSSPDCTLVEEVPGLTVTITCAHETVDAPIRETGSAAVQTTTTMILTPDGISELSQRYAGSHFQRTGNPFVAWMVANHPGDADAAGCCAGSTVEESIARGELRAAYATRWAAQLED